MIKKKGLRLINNHKYEDMEIATNIFAESVAEFTTSEAQHVYFNPQAFDSTGPGDDDEEEGEKETEEDEDKSKGSDDDNPPLDKDVVHSPLNPQSGGKPK